VTRSLVRLLESRCC